MAYAGQSTSRSSARGGTRPGRAPDLDRTAARDFEYGDDVITEPTGRPYSRTLEWGDAGLLGAGIAIGVMIGAGAALLFAPQSGADTRDDIARGTRDFGYRATDIWDDLREELRHAATRSSSRLRRGVRRGRAVTDDVVGAVRRRR